MAKTNSQIQADYRTRQVGNGSGAARLDILLSIHAKNALQRLAGHSKLSQRAMLEKLITDAQSNLIDTMNGDQQAAFYRASERA